MSIEIVNCSVSKLKVYEFYPIETCVYSSYLSLVARKVGVQSLVTMTPSLVCVPFLMAANLSSVDCLYDVIW